MGTVNYKVEKKVAYVTYQNKPLNILNLSDLKQLANVMEDLDKDNEVSVIVFKFDNVHKKVSCAGMNLDEMLSNEKAEDIEKYCRESKDYYMSLYKVSKPTIYVLDKLVRGGGFEMSLFADIRIAGTDLDIALPEIGLGIIPGGGGTQTLSRFIGKSKAKELIFTGNSINAEVAYSMGIVNHVYDSSSLNDNVKMLAETIANHSSLALQAAKNAINNGIELSLNDSLRYETSVFVNNFNTEDASEGILAFKEKRKPIYKNK